MYQSCNSFGGIFENVSIVGSKLTKESKPVRIVTHTSNIQFREETQ